MNATRMDVRTAIASSTSVRRSPISVLMALSECGLLRVITAMRSSNTYSTSTDGPDSASSGDGGAKSSDFQRSMPVMDMRSPRVVCSGSGGEVRQPPEGPQPGGEAVLPAPGDDEGRHVRQPASDRVRRDGEDAGPVGRPDEGVLLGRRADEDPVVEPLGLDELELALEVCSGEDEDDAPVGTVVLEDAVGQHRAVARAPADHAVQPGVDAHLVVEGVPRVRPAGMRPGWTLEPA